MRKSRRFGVASHEGEAIKVNLLFVKNSVKEKFLYKFAQ